MTEKEIAPLSRRGKEQSSGEGGRQESSRGNHGGSRKQGRRLAGSCVYAVGGPA